MILSLRFGTVAFHVLGRLRQPAMLILIVIAAFAVDRVIRLRPAPAIAVTLTLVGVGLGLRPDPVLHRDTDYLMAAAASESRSYTSASTASATVRSSCNRWACRVTIRH